MKAIPHTLFLILLLVAFAAPRASADIALFESALNLNGAIVSPSGAPANVNVAGFDFATGLGTIAITYSPGTVGSYFFRAFFDHEIDEFDNTFYNEYGSVTGAPSAGLSWEIDEPGYVFGDIYTNFTAGTLDNSNAVPASAPDDVSMALGWTFAGGPGDTAVFNFVISDTAPASGFYLQQTDPDSSKDIYFSSSATFSTPTTVPEPGSVILLLTMGASLALCSRRLLKTLD